MHLPDGKNNDIKSLLIVDESVAEGKTDAAIMDHLLVADTPKETKVTLGMLPGGMSGPRPKTVFLETAWATAVWIMA